MPLEFNCHNCIVLATCLNKDIIRCKHLFNYINGIFIEYCYNPDRRMKISKIHMPDIYKNTEFILSKNMHIEIDEIEILSYNNYPNSRTLHHEPINSPAFLIYLTSKTSRLYIKIVEN